MTQSINVRPHVDRDGISNRQFAQDELGAGSSYYAGTLMDKGDSLEHRAVYALSSAFRMDGRSCSESGVEQRFHPERVSAEVRLELRACGQVYDLASIGPNQLIPRHPLDLPSCDAEVVMFVDRSGFLWPVRLPNGAVPFEKAILTSPRGDMQRLGTTQSPLQQ